MARLVHSVRPAVAAVAALAVIIVVPPLVDAAIPTRETPISAGTEVTLTATGIGAVHGTADPSNGVSFQAPEAMRRIATGDISTGIFESDIGEQRLGVSVVDGITDFDTAAPRLLLPLRAAGREVHFDGNVIDAGAFHGVLCVLPDTAGGVCAVANSGDIAVTITVTGPTREAGRALIQAVLASSRAVRV
ncbi:hypothetical protein OHB26_35970 [Nocardia sp. NBC_01503]|uniref:hypothetical protein n=1 Tax=Nocardia sp. NBC_01503 TaxID=2975997 RepID=UPI002E7BAE5E|nr:hypothetical protein [Nocardia sp. NBC_01503]WTL32227.1 hypothetical protein OHB26_35970 [Nocardia sp. NBC_01503]